MNKLLGIMVLVGLISGCSVFMAAHQPNKKNIDLFTPGVHRSDIIGEFGTPTMTEEKDDGRHDIFRFRQGYHTASKVGRAVFHGIADVFTLGLWEVIGTPIESIADGNDMAYEVIYGKDDRVKQVIPLTEKQTGEIPNNQ